MNFSCKQDSQESESFDHVRFQEHAFHNDSCDQKIIFTRFFSLYFYFVYLSFSLHEFFIF